MAPDDSVVSVAVGAWSYDVDDTQNKGLEMPLLPMGPPQGGGLAAPPMGAPAPQGLMPPPPMDVPPAGAGALALAPLAQQQQAQLDAFKQQQAQEAMAVALQAIGSLPNPAAEAAQTEPAPAMSPGVGAQDQMTQGGY